MKSKTPLLMLSVLLLIAASVPIFQKPDLVPTQDDTLVITDNPAVAPVVSRVSVSNLAKVLVLDASNTVAGVFPPARLGTGTPDNSTFLRGDGQFTAIPGGGDMLKSTYDGNTDGRVDLASGGTGANTAAGARTALGLVIGTDVEARDATISKLGSTIEESELNLADNTTNNASTLRHGLAPKLPGNTVTFLRGDGVFATPAGSGDMLRSTYDPDTDGTIAVPQGGTGGTTAAAARANLGLVIGTDVLGVDAELAAWAGLTSAADTLGYFTGSGTASTTPFTSFARTILDDTSAAAVRSTIGAGTGNGTVTSVGITAPSQFTVSGNPLTSAGSIAITWTGTGTNLQNIAQAVTVNSSGNIATPGTITAATLSGSLNGSQIESGTVGASYIDSAIARDSEVAAAYQPLDQDLTTVASLTGNKATNLYNAAAYNTFDASGNLSLSGKLTPAGGIDLTPGGTIDLIGTGQMTNVQADAITSTTGSGAPNFPSGIKLGGVTQTSWPAGGSITNRVGVRRVLTIPASAWDPCTTNPATAYTNTTSNIRCWSFAESNTNRIVLAFPVPDLWDTSSNFLAKCTWTSTNSSGTAVWQVRAAWLRDDDAINSLDYGTARTTSDAVTSANDLLISAATGAITPSGTAATGALLKLELFRDPSHASDSLVGSAELIAVQIQYIEAQTETALWN